MLLALLAGLRGIGTAAPLCTTGTMAQYLAMTGPCAISAGPVDLLFSFGSNAYLYTTDGTPTLTPAQITVTPVANQPGNHAGFTFSSSFFRVPGDATYADINLVYTVKVDPAGDPHYHLHSAHVELAGHSGFLGVFEADMENVAFLVYRMLPDGSYDQSDATYTFMPTLVRPATNVYMESGAVLTSFTETFDVIHAPEPGSWALMAGGLILVVLFRTPRFAKPLAIFAAVIMASASAQATTLCTDTQAIGAAVSPSATINPSQPLNLATYIKYGQTVGACEIGGLLFTFTDFTVATTGTPATVPSAGDYNNPSSRAGNAVSVSFFQSPVSPGLLTTGVQFLPVAQTKTSPPFDSSIVFSVAFTVQAPTYVVTSYKGTSSGNASGREVTITPSMGSPIVKNGTQISATPLSQPLGTTLSVTDKFTLSSGAPPRHVSQFTDQFTQLVPEPVTSTLVGGALIGLLAFARRRRA